MKHPLVSVIIPNYNHAQFLYQRIDSVLKQDYDNYEVIILDDKSTDNSTEIINKISNHPKVKKVIINTKNSGSPFKQWQKGFAYANGELIWIAESDDYSEPSFLSKMVLSFEIDSLCVLSFCRTIRVNINGEPIGQNGFDNDFSMGGNQFIHKYLYRHNYIANASSVLFCSHILNGLDQTFTSFRGCGDWLFWIEICKKGNIAYINTSLNYYRQHLQNTTNQMYKLGKEEEEIIKVYSHLYSKKYINIWQLYRLKVVHLYSLKYGKQQSIPSYEKSSIIKDMNCNIIIRGIVLFARYVNIMGIKLINR